MEQNYVTVTLCIVSETFTSLPSYTFVAMQCRRDYKTSRTTLKRLHKAELRVDNTGYYA